MHASSVPSRSLRGRVGLLALVGASVAGGALLPCAAHAEPPRAAAAGVDTERLAALMPLLASYASRFEEMKRRGTFTLAGKLEELDGGGAATGTKEILVRSVATQVARTNEIVRYLEDGADKTAEAREKAAKREAKPGAKKRDLRLPFLASEQARYRFGIAAEGGAVTSGASGTRGPSRLRVTFTPVTPAEDAFDGSAWVDAATGDVLTMGFSPSKTSMFVDHVDITIRFDLATPLGRAPSSVTFEASGGVLFFRKRVRGTGTISDPSLGF
jgi:hypothetical protein